MHTIASRRRRIRPKSQVDLQPLTMEFGQRLMPHKNLRNTSDSSTWVDRLRTKIGGLRFSSVSASLSSSSQFISLPIRRINE